MTDSLIRRLRGQLLDGVDTSTVMRHAAARIEGLEAELARVTRDLTFDIESVSHANDLLKAQFKATADLCDAYFGRMRQLEKALRIIASYTGHDSAAWAAREIARNAFGPAAEGESGKGC